MRSIRWMAVVTLISGALVGCSAVPPAPSGSAQYRFRAPFGSMEVGSSRPPGGPPGLTPRSSIVRYIGIDPTHWPTATSNKSYSDLYTQIEVYAPQGSITGAGSGNPDLRDYSSERRGWLAQLWATRTDTAAAVVNVEIMQPSLRLALPLFSVSHSSGWNLGNTWTTNFTDSNVESPLFRIGSDTSITLHLNLKVSSDLKSQGVSEVVGAVTQAVRIAAPSARLLTTLSKSEVNNAAQAIDQSISALFSQNITEDIALGRLMESWSPTSQVIITGCAPFVRLETSPGTATPPPDRPAQDTGCGVRPDTVGGSDTRVGAWRLSLACPRLSAFDPRDICNDLGSLTVGPGKNGTIPLTSAGLRIAHTYLASEISDVEVLQFMLSSQVTIQDFVQSQNWFTTFVRKGAAASAGDYTDFCSNAILSLYAAGLNKFDAALALRAVIDRVPGIVENATAFQSKGTTCLGLLADTNVSLHT